MFKFILAIGVFICGVQGIPVENARIVGGTDAEAGEFPFIVSIRVNGYHYCGGSILSEKWILTAAHCVEKIKDPARFKVYYGILKLSEPAEGIQVEKIFQHEAYVHAKGYFNDVALMKLEIPIKMSATVQTVELPEATEIPKAKTGVLAGWGSKVYLGDESDILQKATLDIIPDATCLKNEIFYDSKIQLCAGRLTGGRGQCSGDSGGPLLVRGKQFGIVSWSKKPCGQPGHAGVLAKVTTYLPWIRNIINNN